MDKMDLSQTAKEPPMNNRLDTRLRKLRQAPLCGDMPAPSHTRAESGVGHLWVHGTCWPGAARSGRCNAASNRHSGN